MIFDIDEVVTKEWQVSRDYLAKNTNKKTETHNPGNKIQFKSRLEVMVADHHIVPNPLVHLLEDSGTILKPKEFKLSLHKIIQTFEKRTQSRLRDGLIKEDQVIHVGQVFRDENKEIKAIPFGGEIPPQYEPIKPGIYSNEIFFKSIAQGVYPVGNSHLTSLGEYSFGSVFTHDLTHLAGMYDDLEYMAYARQAAIEFVEEYKTNTILQKFLELVNTPLIPNVPEIYETINYWSAYMNEVFEAHQSVSAKKLQELASALSFPEKEISQHLKKLSHVELIKLAKNYLTKLPTVFLRYGAVSVDPLIRQSIIRGILWQRSAYGRTIGLEHGEDIEQIIEDLQSFMKMVAKGQPYQNVVEGKHDQLAQTIAKHYLRLSIRSLHSATWWMRSLKNGTEEQEEAKRLEKQLY